MLSNLWASTIQKPSEIDSNQIRRLLVLPSKLFSINSLRLSHRRGCDSLAHYFSLDIIFKLLRSIISSTLPLHPSCHLPSDNFPPTLRLYIISKFSHPTVEGATLRKLWRSENMGKEGDIKTICQFYRKLLSFLKITEKSSPFCRQGTFESIEKDCFSM